MKTKKIDLSWIVVSDIKKSKQFFTEIVGLKIKNETPEYGWLELEGHEGGSTLGVGQAGPEHDDKPGQNAVVTFNIDNIVDARKELESKKVKLIGDIVEVPGHVKMATFTDFDGNKFQLVETLDH